MFVRGMTPRRAQVVALTGTGVFGVLAVVALALWWFQVVPDSRLTLAVYLTLLLFAVMSGCAALLSACSVAIHQAFRAGFQTGQVAAEEPDPLERARHRAERGRDDPVLRLLQ